MQEASGRREKPSLPRTRRCRGLQPTSIGKAECSLLLTHGALIVHVCQRLAELREGVNFSDSGVCACLGNLLSAIFSLIGGNLDTRLKRLEGFFGVAIRLLVHKMDASEMVSVRTLSLAVVEELRESKLSAEKKSCIACLAMGATKRVAVG